MNINKPSSYKKAKRFLFKQNCLKRSLSYVELQVGFEEAYDLLITRELHYHCAIEALGV